MVVIRLSRGGNSKNPFYHIVVADHRKARDGRFIERVGYFSPMARGQDIRLKVDDARITHWIQQGAVPSERVAYLLKALHTSPETAQKAGLRKSEVKKQQSEKAEKHAAAAKKEMAKAEKPAETSESETPSTDTQAAE